ncbi:MAG: hypothetical protein GXO96_08060 [Nitrospirae bacterium]|nr:hypothetical protein [Candidatus Manganitrophaceae bacterium]
MKKKTKNLRLILGIVAFLGIVSVLVFSPTASHSKAIASESHAETEQAEEPLQHEQVLLKVDGMTCFTCRWDIKRKLMKVPGVTSAQITSKQLTWWNPFSKSEGKALIIYEAGTVTTDQLIEVIEGESDAVYTYKASVLSESFIEE